MRISICNVICLSLCLLFQYAFAGGPEMPSKRNGFYLTGDVGGATFQQQHSNSSLLLNIAGVAVGNAVAINETDGRNAFNLTGSVGLGWQFSPLFRIDITYTYLRFPLITHNFDVATVGGEATTVLLITARSDVYLLNAYLNLASLFRRGMYSLQPYIGAGVGWANNRTNDDTVIGNTVPFLIGNVSDTHRSEFAYRVIAGFIFPLARGLRIFTQYSYVCTGKYEVGAQLTTNLVNGIFTTPPKFHAHSNIFSVGLIYLF